MRGDFAATEAALGPLLELSGTFGDDPLDGLHGAATFMVHRETGLDDVRPLITGDPANEPGTWRLGLLALYTEFGMVDAATHVLDELMQTAYAAMAAEKHHGTAAAFLSDAIMLVGSTSHARRLYDVLLPRSGTNLLTGHFVCVWGSADRYLGMLAGLCGEDAEPHFEMALAMDRKMASIVHEAETLARYAGFLHDRDRRLSTECAMRAEQLAASIGSGRAHRILEPRRTDGQPLLTPREIEVLGQIALGASNREIAERLFISAHTAANHVRNILTKTGARNRTQAVRIATDAGLLH
jgi:DNA-binding CsgD family transcriptional regulator